MGVAGSLLASVIWSIAETSIKSIRVVERPTVSAEQSQESRPMRIDVGPNLVQIVTGMNATNKPWSLYVEDTKTGQKVKIEYGRRN